MNTLTSTLGRDNSLNTKHLDNPYVIQKPTIYFLAMNKKNYAIHYYQKALQGFFCYSTNILVGLVLLGMEASWLTHISWSQEIPLDKETPLLAIPPLIRPPEVYLDLQSTIPTDFDLAAQLPDEQGRRRISFTSQSTGIEQTYRTTLPNTSQFELYEVEYNNLSQLDLSGLRGSSRAIATQSDLNTTLNSFKITFTDGRVEKVTLATGEAATFTDQKAIIKNPAGQVIEIINLAQKDKAEIFIAATNRQNKSDFTELSVPSLAKASTDFLLAQYSNCSSQVNTTLNTINLSLKADGKKLLSSSSDLTQLFGWTLAFGGDSLKSTLNSRRSELQPIICKPPSQCDQRKIEGGQEISHILFELPEGNRHTLAVEYEFFEIPDRLEVYSDGKKIFSDGPRSGHHLASNIILDEKNNFTGYIGVNLIGNPNDSDTRWWYTIACSSETVLINKNESLPMVDNPSSITDPDINVESDEWFEDSSGSIK